MYLLLERKSTLDGITLSSELYTEQKTVENSALSASAVHFYVLSLTERVSDRFLMSIYTLEHYEMSHLIVYNRI